MACKLNNTWLHTTCNVTDCVDQHLNPFTIDRYAKPYLLNRDTETSLDWQCWILCHPFLQQTRKENFATEFQLFNQTEKSLFLVEFPVETKLKLSHFWVLIEVLEYSVKQSNVFEEIIYLWKYRLSHQIFITEWHRQANHVESTFFAAIFQEKDEHNGLSQLLAIEYFTNKREV